MIMISAAITPISGPMMTAAIVPLAILEFCDEPASELELLAALLAVALAIVWDGMPFIANSALLTLISNACVSLTEWSGVVTVTFATTSPVVFFGTVP